MITLNTGLMPVYNHITGINNNNNKKYPNLSGMPQADVFEKKEVSFKGIYDPFQSTSSKSSKIGKDYTSKELAKLNESLVRVAKGTLYYAMDPISNCRRLINIEEPKVKIINSKMPRDGWNTSGGKNVHYDWVNNTILIDRSYMPNILLISNGSVATVPQKLAGDFALNHNLAPEKFKEIKSADFWGALDKSRGTSNLYYMKLPPEDAAELLGPAIAHEMSHMMITHLALNTAGVGSKAFRPFFEKNAENGSLTYYGAQEWESSFPARYVPKNPGSPLFDSDESLSIKGNLDGRNYNVLVEHKDLVKYLFQSDKQDKTNPIEFWALKNAISCCRSGSLGSQKTDREPHDIERMKLLFSLKLPDYYKEETERAKLLDVFKYPIYY